MQYKTPKYMKKANEKYQAKKIMKVKGIAWELAELIDRFAEFGEKSRLAFSKRIAEFWKKYY